MIWWVLWWACPWNSFFFFYLHKGFILLASLNSRDRFLLHKVVFESTWCSFQYQSTTHLISGGRPYLHRRSPAPRVSPLCPVGRALVDINIQENGHCHNKNQKLRKSYQESKKNKIDLRHLWFLKMRSCRSSAM